MTYQVPHFFCVGSLLTAVALTFQPSPSDVGGAPIIVVIASTRSGPSKGAQLMLNPVVFGGFAFSPEPRGK